MSRAPDASLPAAFGIGMISCVAQGCAWTHVQSWPQEELMIRLSAILIAAVSVASAARGELLVAAGSAAMVIGTLLTGRGAASLRAADDFRRLRVERRRSASDGVSYREDVRTFPAQLLFGLCERTPRLAGCTCGRCSSYNARRV